MEMTRMPCRARVCGRVGGDEGVGTWTTNYIFFLQLSVGRDLRGYSR